ncbi:MAG: hypothetical protein K2G03_01085, partial [Bacilli bacterium]|nr:hypothetical protein [Bacilli bacterium]
YLSHSRYGIDKEVNINNNSESRTGYSAYPSTDQSIVPGENGDGGSYNAPYNTSVGYLASTTGNITGVYDMSGGAHEYMASYRAETLGESGFTEETISSYNSKYFDVYNENSALKTNNYRILGDATGEMSPFSYYLDGDEIKRWHNNWYNDTANFIEVKKPWFYRSGMYRDGLLASQFAFVRMTGAADLEQSIRLVLAG